MTQIENYYKAVSDNEHTYVLHHRAEILPCGWFSKESHVKISQALTGHPSHFKGKKRQYSEEGLARISAAHKGKTPWNKGLPQTEEVKQKISNTLKGQPSSFKGKHHTEKSKKAFSDSHRGMHWWNNGTIAKQARECPGEGWILGRGKVKWQKTT